MKLDKSELIAILRAELYRQGQEVPAMGTYTTWPETVTLGVDGVVRLDELAQAIIEEIQ